MGKKAKKTSKQDQLRFLSQSARLEEAVNPRIIRITSWTICASLIAFLGWASMTNIDEVSRAPGEVTPQGFQQIVQHLEGGLIKDIRVTEGEIVEKDDILVILDGAGTQQDLERARSEEIFLSMQRERLKAFSENRKPDFSPWQTNHKTLVEEQQNIFESMLQTRKEERGIIADQIAQKKQTIAILSARQGMVQKNLALANDMYNRRKNLHSEGYISHINFLQTEQELNTLKGESNMIYNQIQQARQEIREYEGRLQSLDSKHRDDALQQINQLQSQLAQNREILAKMNNRAGRLEVQSPVRGLVKGLNVNTIGGVVQPGQALMEIVPLDRQLVVELRIPPKDIGHLKTGMPVQVKISTYDFSRYGAIPGTLEFISPTTFIGDRGERFYRGRVVLERNYAGNNPEQNPVLPGMTVMTDIITGDKTIMAYLLKPIHNSIQTALRER